VNIEELEKFCEYAKVASPPFNPAESFLCLIQEIRSLRRQLYDIEIMVASKDYNEDQ